MKNEKWKMKIDRWRMEDGGWERSKFEVRHAASKTCRLVDL
jgi:hypothetical protein